MFSAMIRDGSEDGDGLFPRLPEERRACEDRRHWCRQCRRYTQLWRNLMKAVVIGESSGASRDAIMAVYPRHKVVVDKFVARGVVLGIGPFTDGGNLAIFKTRADAEAFSKEDPFILEGLVKSFVIKDWRDSLLAE